MVREREDNIISKVDRYVDRYGLRIESIINVDLRETHMQYYCSKELDTLLTVGDNINRNMLNSPHYELAFLYYKKGKKWLVKNFQSTKYYKFRKNVLNRNNEVPLKKLGLFDSILNGYLKNGHEKDHIVILNEPLIKTRYQISNVILNPLEVFMGHHRVGALLALGINKVQVIMAIDTKKGSCELYGKLSENYKEVLKCGLKDMN